MDENTDFKHLAANIRGDHYRGDMNDDGYAERAREKRMDGDETIIIQYSLNGTELVEESRETLPTNKEAW